jgi:AcrR family transcriptional regulator
MSPRRDRPAKPALSREWIIDVTLDVMAREGLRKATMRRVAQEVDTGPASLYVYFRNTAELHAAVIDELLGRMTMPADGPWQPRLEQLVTDYMQLLARNPGLARSALVIRPSGPNLLLLVERLMSLLVEGGADPARAGHGADLLLLTATAAAAEHAVPEDGDADAGTDESSKQAAIVVAIRGADPERTPLIALHGEHLLADTPEDHWRWYLRAQIAGILAIAPVKDER